LPELEKEAKKRETLGKKLTRVEDKGKSTEKAAEKFNTNRQYVSDVKKIKEKSPEKFEQILSGEKSISDVKAEIAGVKIVFCLSSLQTLPKYYRVNGTIQESV
jgi:flagellar hook-basal body complex protein FliE